jgi:GntR family transcriptional regulator/MocR family aminotransferase
VPSAAGLHLCVLERARERGVAFDDLARFYAGERPQSGVVLGYGAVGTEHIAAGLRLLARTFQDEAAYPS